MPHGRTEDAPPKMFCLMSGVSRHPAIMKRLGKHKTGKSCLYIKHLSDVNMTALTRADCGVSR
jgi:hypothetical protein